MKRHLTTFIFLSFISYTLTLFSQDVSRVTSDEMRLPLVKEMIDAPIEIQNALQSYHDTREFKKSPQYFFQHPNEYFETRIETLENLISYLSDDFADLKQRAEYKLAYYKKIPSMMSDHATRFELADYGIKTEHSRLNDNYWFEYLDPLHRIGPEVKVHIDTWLSTSIPNYFIYLETVEYDPLLNQFAPFKHQVIYYLNEEERAPHLLSFEDGVCYLNNEPFDTGESFSLHSDEPGLAIFTIGTDHEVYVNSHIKYKIHHSSEFAGSEVVSAGELKAANGMILEISNKSGHYSPKHREMMVMLKVFNEKLGDLSNIQLVMFQYDKAGKKYFKQFATFNAQEYLNTNGMTPALCATGNWNPLHVAVWNNHIDLAHQVIFPEQLEEQDFQGNTPLHLAVIQGHENWVKALLDAGAGLTVQNELGETPLHISCKSGNEDIVRLLLSKMHYVDLRNHKEQTPLHYAAQSGSWSLYQLLMDHGASNRAYDEDGNHLLHFAVYKGNYEFAKRLLKTDLLSQLFVPNRRNASVLHSAAAFGDRKTMELVLNFGFDLLQKDYKGRTPLHFAAKFGNAETTSCLIELNDKEILNARTNRSLTAFHYAAEHLPLESVKQFMEYGAKINAVDYKGRSALFYAIDGRSVNSLRNLKYLLCHGAYTHIFNTNGQAPVHYAASRGSISSLRRLLSSSNDLNLPDSQGRTALDIAKLKNFRVMTRYLTEHGE